MIKTIFILFFITIITGCSGAWIKSTSSANRAYEPIVSNNSTDIEKYLSNGIEILNNAGYETTPNYVHYTAVTSPKNLGKHRWRINGDKWDIRYQLDIQIIKGSNGSPYWKLIPSITGTRSGKEPRSFLPSDFDITEKIINDIHRKLSISYSSKA